MTHLLWPGRIDRRCGGASFTAAGWLMASYGGVFLCRERWILKPATIWAIFRWLAVALLLAGAFLAANYTLFSIMATVAPPTNQHPEAWAFEVYIWAGNSVVLLCATVFAAVNLRPGLPNLRSRWNLLLLAIALVAIVWPRADHWLEVDRCLDAGGKWEEPYQRCKTE